MKQTGIRILFFAILALALPQSLLASSGAACVLGKLSILVVLAAVLSILTKVFFTEVLLKKLTANHERPRHLRNLFIIEFLVLTGLMLGGLFIRQSGPGGSTFYWIYGIFFIGVLIIPSLLQLRPDNETSSSQFSNPVRILKAILNVIIFNMVLPGIFAFLIMRLGIYALIPIECN